MTKIAVLPKRFISCDWGTTNFRLKLVETETLRVLAQHSTDRGIRSMHEGYIQQPKPLERISFFSNYLEEQIQRLPVDRPGPLVVMSGMASSNMGLQELDYADLPFDHSGRGLKWKHIATENGRNILLISGVKSNSGMMRGEEVQAIGLHHHLSSYQHGVLILPGTHSKHLIYKEGQFTDLRTYMTGELFEIISRHSILSKSICQGNWDKSTRKAFDEGLQIGLTGGLTSNLFAIRALDVLRDYPKHHNYYRLSGMLIGDELSSLKANQTTVFLAAPDQVFHLYRAALEEIVQPGQLVLMNEKALEQALLIGQKKILLAF